MPAWFLVADVIDVAIAGMGVWSDLFENTQQLLDGMESGQWPDVAPLAPELIAPRERRRAPKTVKLAIEAMSQAYDQAASQSASLASAQPDSAADLPPNGICVVAASSMGDMDITDSMCRTLAAHPHLVSPTTFHNSVHNAAVGYWSIGQASHAACNAVAAGEYTSTVGLLEAAALCQDSQIPVLFVVFEGQAPDTLMPLCTSPHPLALSFLLTPPGQQGEAMPTLKLATRDEATNWPELPTSLADAFSLSPAGRMLPLFIALAGRNSTSPIMSLPLSPYGSLRLDMGFGPQASLR